MRRHVSAASAAALAVGVALAAVPAPALAQATYAPEAAPIVVAPAVVVVPATAYAPRMRYRLVAREVLVPRTRYVRRAVLVPRMHYVRRVLRVPVTTYVARTEVAGTPFGPYALGAPVADYAPVYSGTGLVGPTWVPPGTSYSCVLGTVGCDSSVVGATAF